MLYNFLSEIILLSQNKIRSSDAKLVKFQVSTLSVVNFG